MASPTSATSTSADLPAFGFNSPPPSRSTEPRQGTTKKANQPFLVHQRWKAQQAAQSASPDSYTKSGHSARGKKSAASTSENAAAIVLRLVGLLVKVLLMGVAGAALAGVFVTGDPVWGYRGKWTNLRTYVPVSSNLAVALEAKEAPR